ncbi:NUDIX domain-containing protein [Halomonas sp. ML-15]|uniref:NUDIX hydrolase n=1 Tax=Halomonas sp. ML-15 TaxID=2773305 RepID=UPI001747CDC7|nr:NUDIX domain-containing protein [Halomonas sp. ML-15]MBD3895760.1 NUDIX domain-containing protein [Halomonas sp. ML-15]
MQRIERIIHPDLTTLDVPAKRVLRRRAARGIVLDGEEILLLYTRRYNDFSFPGGGVDEGEELLDGLHRELAEETGAQGIEMLAPFGWVEEFRPHYKPEYDIMHMASYFYHCRAERALGEARPEGYEVANGMLPRWVNIHEAIAHNLSVMAAKEASMGLSIRRETLMLERVSRELVAAPVDS